MLALFLNFRFVYTLKQGLAPSICSRALPGVNFVEDNIFSDRAVNASHRANGVLDHDERHLHAWEQRLVCLYNFDGSFYSTS